MTVEEFGSIFNACLDVSIFIKNRSLVNTPCFYGIFTLTNSHIKLISHAKRIFTKPFFDKWNLVGQKKRNTKSFPSKFSNEINDERPIFLASHTIVLKYVYNPFFKMYTIVTLLWDHP